MENSIISKMSAGEKQRLGLANALLSDPSFLILDEPTAFLDADLKKKIARYFSDQKDWTVVVTSHDHSWKRSDGFKTIGLG